MEYLFSSSKSFYAKPLNNAGISTSTYLHIIYGPSPLDTNKIEFLPRLRAALDIARVGATLPTGIAKKQHQRNCQAHGRKNTKN